MTEIVDIKTRIKSKAPVDEPDVTLAQFLQDVQADKDLSQAVGGILVTWDKDCVSNISHFGASWMEILWYATELARYASEPEEEDEE